VGTESINTFMLWNYYKNDWRPKKVTLNKTSMEYKQIITVGLNARRKKLHLKYETTNTKKKPILILKKM